MVPRPSRALRPTLALALVLAVGGLLLGGPARAVAEPQESAGYLELSDGVGLRYTVVLPPGKGPFPVVLQYSGYNPGNDPYDRSFARFAPMLLERGIAVIGVNLRGSGCSEGTFVPFDEQWASDGAEVVEWIAAQEWSTGDVAMLGTSFPAITAYATATRRPDHLRAIVPIVPLADLYRDVVYPGGIFNASFAEAWTVLQKYGTAFAMEEIARGDKRCAAAVAQQNDAEHVTGVEAATHPYVDSHPGYSQFFSPAQLAAIDVPVLTQTAWQDEQLGSRPVYALDHLDPSRTWSVVGNGTHGGFENNDWFAGAVIDFVEHFLRGGDPGDVDLPRVTVVKEITSDQTFTTRDSYAAWPPPSEQTTLYATPDAALGLSPPTAEAAFPYRYPQPAPSWFVGVLTPPVHDDTYQVPVAPGGSVSFTSPRLGDDLEVLGPASLDLWLSSTAADTDLQVSLTEVRPDGQELYVQRGWLRASHRQLDPEQTTATRPFHFHRSDTLAPLESGAPTPLRVEVWPVGHVFRAGSALRVTVEAPVGFTGFRQLELEPTPAVNTIHVGPDTPTRLVFSRLVGGGIATELPACGTLANQPCRPSPEPPPEGELTFDQEPRSSGRGTTPASDRTQTAQTPEAGPEVPSLPATGGGLSALLGAAVIGLAGAMHRLRKN